MSRCGCAQGGCGCVINQGPGIIVTGTGSKTDPYIVKATGGGGGGGGASINDSTPSTVTVYSSSKVVALLTRLNGTIALPPPTNSADDDVALTAATTLAGSAGKIIAQTGTYYLSSAHTIVNGVSLEGQGSGSASNSGLTRFVCHGASAQINFAGGGAGPSGGFEIDGNHSATTPFQRLGGTGANNRVFYKIIVRDNAVSGSNSNDLANFFGAQNDSWYDCAFVGADRDARHFDQGYGGANFFNCKTNTYGRYSDNYDTVVSGGVYPQPTEIHHWGGIIEGPGGVSLVKMTHAQLISYNNFQFYSQNQVSGPQFDLTGGFGIALHNPFFQSTPGTQGGVGISVGGTCDLTITGAATFYNYTTGIQMVGVGGRVYEYMHASFFNTATAIGGTSGGSSLQCAAMVSSVRSAKGTGGTAQELTYNAAQDGWYFKRNIDGSMFWGSGASGNFGFDVAFGRRAVGAIGTTLGTAQVVCTGQGATAARPAVAAALAGALYVNQDTDSIDFCDGVQWFSTSAGAGAGAPAALPAYVTTTTRTNRFNPNTSDYNGKGTNRRKTRAGLGKAMVNGSARHLMMGDSLTAACVQGITTPYTFDKLNAWPIHYHAELLRHGIADGGTGWVRPVDANIGGDPRWTSTGTWTGVGKGYLSAAGSGATATFTTDKAGICFSLRYWDQGNGTQTFTISIMGAVSGNSFATVTSVSGTAQWRTITLIPDTPLAATNTTVITTGSGGLQFVAGNVWSPGGLQVSNIAQSSSWASGTGSQNWSDYTASTGLGGMYDHIDGPDPVTVTDLVTTSGSATVTSATASFSAAHKGMPLRVNPATSGALVLPHNTYIRTVNSATSVTLARADGGSANALRTTTGQSATFGAAPDLVHCFLGGNDLANGVALATIIAALTAIRTHYATSDFMLHIGYQPATSLVSGATFDAWVNGVYDLADTLDVEVFDHRDDMGTWTTDMMGNGLAGDGLVHMTAAAMASIGRRVGLAVAA